MTANASDSPSADMRAGLIRWAVRGFSYKAFVALILCLAVGRLDWAWGWAYVAVFLGYDIACAILFMPRNPGLLLERSGGQAGMKRWDLWLLAVSVGLLPMLVWVVAGLDERLGWGPEVPLWGHLVALALTILGYGIVVWAMAANAFFSTIVRIQTERGHTVATGGPYRFVRHPGYVGTILFTGAMPFLLGSWWALIPAVPAIALLIVRTRLEDDTLRAELNGYEAYTRQTHYRLLPGVW